MENHREKVLKYLKVTNSILVGTIFAFALFVMIDPLIPALSYEVQNLSVKKVFAQETDFSSTPLPPMPTPNLTEDMNILYIPKINVKQEIIESATIKGIGHKAWRRPNTSTPVKGGRTVIIGHRYGTIGGKRESVMYNLPKMEKGDLVYVYWESNVYTYEVFDKKIVPPTAVQVEFATVEPTLTLYTCTPLWTAKNRLVVDAKLISTSPIVNSIVKK